jgi:hypothetical protein
MNAPYIRVKTSKNFLSTDDSDHKIHVAYKFGNLDKLHLLIKLGKYGASGMFCSFNHSATSRLYCLMMILSSSGPDSVRGFCSMVNVISGVSVNIRTT